MDTLRQDVRYALRGMLKHPGFTAAVIVTLGLGIGANTAIFSVVHAVLLKPIPYPADAPDAVLVIAEKTPTGGQMGVSYPTYRDWVDLVEFSSVGEMAAYIDRTASFSGREQPVRLPIRYTSASYFDIQGVRPLRGRFYTADEDVAGGPSVVVLNHPLWQGRFGGREEIVGEDVILDGEAATVIGILPDDFELMPEERFYAAFMPWADANHSKDRGDHQGVNVLTRTAPGATFERARAELDAIAKRFEAEYPDSNSGVGLFVEQLVERRLREYRSILWMLLGAVGLVLLIACTNVANLLLARGASRHKKTAIFAALGAGRRRLLRQGLTESVILATLGGVAGLVLARWALALLRVSTPFDVPRLAGASLDGQVLWFTLALSGLTGVLFGLMPALQATRVDLNDALKEGGRQSGGGGGRVRRLFLVSEVALATILLVGAGLLVRTVAALTQVDPGFRPTGLLTLQMGLPLTEYEQDDYTPFYRQLIERLAALPGVESAGVGSSLPMQGVNWSSIMILGDLPVPPRAELATSVFNPIGPGYFETLGIPLLEGRTLNQFDTADSQRVVVVNDTLARRHWPNESALGKRLKQGWPESEGDRFPWREIVGVVGSAKQHALDRDARAETYIPYAQNPSAFMKVVLRTTADPTTLIEPARAVVTELDGNIPIYDIRSMNDAIASTTAPRRFTMWLLAVFAAAALALSAIGIYGVIAYSVAQRTQEMGLRLALGADRSHVFRLIVGQGMRLAVIGLAVGVAGAFALTRLLDSLLYGISARDPGMFVAVPSVLGLVALLACAIPALRAMRTDPMTALRVE